MKPCMHAGNSARNVVFIKGVSPTLPWDRASVKGGEGRVDAEVSQPRRQPEEGVETQLGWGN